MFLSVWSNPMKTINTIDNHTPGNAKQKSQFKQTRCKDINSLLTRYAVESESLSRVEMEILEEHISDCPKCKNEFAIIRRINEDTCSLDDACEREMATIDWEENAYTISSRIPFKQVSSSPSYSRWAGLRFYFRELSYRFQWKYAVPVVAGIFLLGISLGYFLFHVSPTGSDELKNELVPIASSEDSVATLENTLARKEITGYFSQTQLVLTDLMKQCNNDGTFSFQSQMDLQRVRSLLDKNRYFNQNLNDPQFMSSKKLLKKIEWLLFEILMSDTNDKTSCQKLQELQEYIKNERLLFKIRLVGKDLSVSEI